MRVDHPVTRSVTCIAIALLLGAGFGATAQAEQPNGAFRDWLLQVLRMMADQQCPSTMMSLELAEACESQIVEEASRLRQLGEPVNAVFRGWQPSALGVVEEYDVEFPFGRFTWFISVAPDGRIVLLWRLD